MVKLTNHTTQISPEEKRTKISGNTTTFQGMQTLLLYIVTLQHCLHRCCTRVDEVNLHSLLMQYPFVVENYSYHIKLPNILLDCTQTAQNVYRTRLTSDQWKNRSCLLFGILVPALQAWSISPRKSISHAWRVRHKDNVIGRGPHMKVTQVGFEKKKKKKKLELIGISH